MSEIIKYENVTFKRNDRLILDSISWTVNKGENWALLGLNGAGKSTIINMITAYDCPTSGDVSVLGHTFGQYDWQKVKDKIGFVSNTLNRFLGTLNSQTVRDIVLSGNHNTIGFFKDLSPEDKSKAESLLENFRLRKVENSRYSTLSQGEQRLTLLARAFMNDPDLLVLDEPCSGLDIRARETLLSTLERQMNNTNSTILYITHQIEEITSSITHVALLYDGKMMAQGEKEMILTEELLSKAYDVPVKLTWNNGRPWLMVL